MNFRQPPSKFKNQILTALKRDQFHSELDLTKDTIGNDSSRTVQANHDTIIFSCGNTGLGFVPLDQPGKFGYQHPKINCGHVSDIHISPFVSERLVAVTCNDLSVKIYRIPILEREEDVGSALHEFRASAGTANTPVLVCWNPQVSGILAVGSGNKLDVYSTSSGEIVHTVNISSPAVTLDWSHDGSKVLIISKDATLRIVEPRLSEITTETKLGGTKHVIKSLAGGQFLVSSLSKMRERELNLYSSDEPSKALKTWNFGTASTPLVPIPDTVRKVVYLLDKSGGVLRWVETFAPYNEGAAGTSVDQSSNACLIHPFGLRVMEGEINRLMIADTKGNTVPVKVSIGRKSYLEFHDDLYTPIEIESSISAEEWLHGSNGMARMAKVEPSLLKAASNGESLSKFAVLPTTEKKSEEKFHLTKSKTEVEQPRQSSTASAPVRANTATSSSTPDKGMTTLSAREQRKWDKEEAAAAAAAAAAAQTPEMSRDIDREDSSARRAEHGAPSPVNLDDKSAKSAVKPQDELKSMPDTAPVSSQEQSSTRSETTIEDTPGRGAPPLDDEDALERLRARRVTPAIERLHESEHIEIQSPQPQKEVFREDLSARRAEYGAAPSPGLREVSRENLAERRAEYGAKSKASPSQATTDGQIFRTDTDSSRNVKESQAEEPKREVFREDLTARRSEYGALASPAVRTFSSPKPPNPALSAREQRKWDKDEAKSSGSPLPKVHREATPVDLVSAAPRRTTTAEREVFKEDLTSRRAEYGATPRLDGPTQAYKEITRALGKSEPQSLPVPQSQVELYRVDDDLESPAEPTKEELENAYAPPIEESTIDEKKPDIAIDNPAAIIEKVSSQPSQKTSSSQASRIEHEAFRNEAPHKETVTSKQSTPTEHKDYTRKYLEGRPQHPRNSYTTLVGLNASLPNTARMIDATPFHIIVPLAGPGGRLGIIPYEKSGRLPPLINGFTGGAQVVDFELDKLENGRVVSAHADQAVRIWTIPANLDELEADIPDPDHVLTGLDRILSLSLHPCGVKDLLLITTATKLHLFDVATAKELASFPAKGVASSTWSLDGKRIALGKSDKSISILDSRTGKEIISFPSVHQSTRLFRLQFVGEDRIISAGFGRGSTRQLALYNLADGSSLQVHDMDISPSPFSLPFFDEMSSILYLIPRGTSNILPFHIHQSGFTPLPPYAAPDPVMGTTFLAPQVLDTAKVEIARCLRITTNEVTVVGFHIPRPSGDFFHDDIYPSHVRDNYRPSLTVQEWLSGKDPSEHPTFALNSKGLKASSTNPTSIGKKAGSSAAKIAARGPETKKRSELDEMFSKAKGENGDEPENQNDAPNTRWD